jgi:hypothetical protein
VSRIVASPCNHFAGPPFLTAGDTAMLIYVLALVMTVLMLIATAFGMHQETLRVRSEERRKQFDGFGLPRRR